MNIKKNKLDKINTTDTKTTIKTALSIAGSDPSGGAGIQADLKTMTVNGVYAMSAITALTVQNTTGVKMVSDVSPDVMRGQLEAVFDDIYPDAVKIGMLPNSVIMEVVADVLTKYKAENIVLDTIMISTSGTRLMADDAMEVFKNRLMMISSLVTPNIPEIEVLTGINITTREDMEKAAKVISETYGCSVLCKGGHFDGNADDLLYHDGKYEWFYGEKIDNPNTHGTGCTLSSAIAANLAKGYDMVTSVRKAKEYITGAISAMLNLGKGNGPMHHGYDIESRFTL